MPPMLRMDVEPTNVGGIARFLGECPLDGITVGKRLRDKVRAQHIIMQSVEWLRTCQHASALHDSLNREDKADDVLDQEYVGPLVEVWVGEGCRTWDGDPLPGQT